MTKDLAKYVVQQASGIYRYYRRIPTEVAHLDKRSHVRQSLKTTSLREALAKAQIIHDASEKYWQSLLAGQNSTTAIEQYQAAVRIATSLGFTYKPANELATVSLDELEQRFQLAEAAHSTSATTVMALTGLAPDPAPKLSDVWRLYESFNAAGLTGMSTNQLRDHKVSRERAIKYATDELGDIELAAVTRPDVLRFRDWWSKKVAREGLKAYTANRCFSDIMGMISIIDDALHTEFKKPWEKSRIKETNKTKLKKRHPFSVDFVRDTILAETALSTMNDDARCIVYVMIETGMRLGEVCNLRPEDIRLDDEVPHVEVADRDDRRQKTEHSIRRVPLVGVALWAMKRHPNGFPRYQDKAKAASALINKMMGGEGLRPTKRHSAYSFRHTFQDRIENAETSDRMQADLMGHEFGRPTYGDGPEMRRRQALLTRLMFSPAWLDQAAA